MVEPHGCDDRQFGRVNDVGRIQRAAHADLQHHDVAPAARKIQHSQAGDEFKLRRMLRHRLRVRIHLRGQRGERLIRNGLSVHLHPLVKPVDKRRDVQPHPVSGRPQDGRHHGRRAALAVGAGHGGQTAATASGWPSRRSSSCVRERPGMLPRHATVWIYASASS